MKIADYVTALPDSFKKNPESNNYKLLSMEQGIVQGFRDDIQAVSDVLDILKANGKTLDLFGEIYSQARGGMNDEQYRYAILQKAARLLSGCDHESVVTALSVVFDVPVTSFAITDAEQNCVVDVKNLPFSVLQNIGITAGQAIQMIESMLAVGVRLADVNFEGTFEFGDAEVETDENCAFEFGTTESEYDETTGFGDIQQTIGGSFEHAIFAILEYDEEAGFSDNDQTIGGYFGFLSSGDGIDIPA